ncbi:beta-1,3-glucanase family protein [Hymenobacter pini]|uniref:beta-1,3-glucanase family protein n=1 Tax=Hymenobacter pini TaxID=2880879 RepID=UPI001CF2B23B|nr:beta-1,3-glucanase family protein [Hymenobacter pini]MCA8832956.1 beta-1,3-glucanase family protein [Hymenobacter pini]
MRNRTLFAWCLLVLGSLLPLLGRAQGSIPFTIANNSPYADTDLYVAIVGIDGSGNHVWINAANGQVLPMSSSYNTVTGPTYNGNTGPGQNSKYAACFTKLSNIPNKTFTLPYIAGCRVFISQGQQLYLYFFGSSGAPSGYAAPDFQNPNDPNKGIRYEFIELTNNQYGFFGNTTRVDSYNYPMGLELWGNGFYKRAGEQKSHADILAAYQSFAPTEFQGLRNATAGTITCPGKSAQFQSGGAQANYFGSYIDAIWSKYVNEDLIFYAGDAGVFKGRVSNGRLTVVGQSGGFAGRTGIVARKPTTQEVLEGKGALDNRVGDGDCDLVVQSQLCAAINRHVVNTTTTNPGQQNWYNAAAYYAAAPANYYSKFWHQGGISVDNLSYGFAYDDVNDQSSTLHTPQPTKVVATFGGFVGLGQPSSGVATMYKDCNYTGTAVALPVGDYTLSALQSRGILNDDISSLKVNSGYEVVLYENDNYTGASLTVGSAGNSCLVNNALGTSNWNDKATSVRVRAATTNSTFSVTLQAEAANVNNGMTVETCTDTGGGQNMGYVDAGDYLVWNNINFPTTGTYTIEYRVASGGSGGTISSDLNASSIQFGNSTIPGTGGWQNWTTVSKTVTINAGTYNFGIYAQTGGWNINWVRITKSSTAARMATTSAVTTKQDAEQPALALYPNPVVDRLELTSATSLAGSQYRIVNQQGQTLATGTLGRGAVDVAKLPNGMYSLVVLRPDGKTTVHRFLK